MEAFSAFLVFFVANSPVTCEFPSQRPVMQSFDVFLDLGLNKQLSKQSWGWWFEMPLRSLWRHCNDKGLNYKVINNHNFYMVPSHDDVIKWKHIPRYWPFMHGIHQSPVNSPRKGWWCGALMFCLISAWINGWVNNGEAGDLRRHYAH